MVLNVHLAKQVTWFNIGWDWNQPVDKVIGAWQDFFLQGDERWFSHLDLWAKPFPAEKFKQQPIKALGVFYGTPEEARKELAALLNIGKPNTQTIELVNWDKAIKQFEVATSTFITATPEYKSTGAYAKQPLPEEAIKTIVKTLQDSKSPLLNILVFTLGDLPRLDLLLTLLISIEMLSFSSNIQLNGSTKRRPSPRSKSLMRSEQAFFPTTMGIMWAIRTEASKII